MKDFAGAEVKFDEVAATVDEGEARAGEFFEDEAFTAEEAGAEFLDERDVELDGGLGADEAVPLHDDGLAGLEIKSLDVAGVAAGKAYFAVAAGAEVGHKEALAHELALDGAPDFGAQAVALHLGFPTDVGGLVDHLAGFGVEFLAGLELATDDLEIFTLDFVVERFLGHSARCAKCCTSTTRHRRPTFRAESCRVVELSSAICTKGHMK